MEVQIIAIRKSNGNHQDPHEAVSHYKWQKTDGTTGITDRPNMVAWLKKAGNTAYVASGFNKAYCEVRNNGNTEFLQTIADNTKTDNLLQLPPC